MSASAPPHFSQSDTVGKLFKVMGIASWSTHAHIKSSDLPQGFDKSGNLWHGSLRNAASKCLWCFFLRIDCLSFPCGDGYCAPQHDGILLCILRVLFSTDSFPNVCSSSIHITYYWLANIPKHLCHLDRERATCRNKRTNKFTCKAKEP
eukprot:5995925-Amphidinium_carterae.2